MMKALALVSLLLMTGCATQKDVTRLTHERDVLKEALKKITLERNELKKEPCK